MLCQDLLPVERRMKEREGWDEWSGYRNGGVNQGNGM